jgi:hypothetical protein
MNTFKQKDYQERIFEATGGRVYGLAFNVYLSSCKGEN